MLAPLIPPPLLHGLPACRRCLAPSLSSVADVLDRVEEVESDVFQSVSDAITDVRQLVFNSFPAFNTFPMPPNVQLGDGIRILREVLRELLLQERVACVVLLGTTFVLALLGGLTSGVSQSNLEGGTGRKTVGARLLESDADVFRVGFTDDEAVRYDEGGVADLARPLPPPRRSLKKKERTKTSVSAGLWFELLLCVLLDAAGAASLFYPVGGELADVGFAVFYAFLIELFFDWPQLALFAFWEEALPFTDFIPSATIGWLLVVVVGARPVERPTTGPAFRASLAPDFRFAPGVRAPLADRRSYGPANPWLRPNNELWKGDDQE